MRIQTAWRALVAACALALVPQAAFSQCTKLLAFSDSKVCAANKSEVLELAPGATSTECGRTYQCVLHPCITVTLPGDDASCARLETQVNAKKMLSEAYTPPCAISVDGKPFGRVYDADDKSRHFKFNTSAGVVDYALTGKNAAQRVPIPVGAKRCTPRPTQWECSGLGDDLTCYQPGTRFDNGPSLINFAKKGDFNVCFDLAKTLQQSPSLLSVAACLVPPPKPIPPAVTQSVAEAQASKKCPDAMIGQFLDAYTQCVANAPDLNLALDDCCGKVRKQIQEQNGKGIKIFGKEYFKGTSGAPD